MNEQQIDEKNKIKLTTSVDITPISTFVETIPAKYEILLDLLYKQNVKNMEKCYQKIKKYFKDILNEVSSVDGYKYITTSIKNNCSFPLFKYNVLIKFMVNPDYGIFIEACVNNIIKYEIKMRTIRFKQIEEILSERYNNMIFERIFEGFYKFNILNFKNETIAPKLLEIFNVVKSEHELIDKMNRFKI